MNLDSAQSIRALVEELENEEKRHTRIQDQHAFPKLMRIKINSRLIALTKTESDEIIDLLKKQSALRVERLRKQLKEL